MSERTAEYPVPAAIAAHPAWHRLESQRTYYSSKAGSFQTTYKRIKLALIAISAAIPLAALAGDHAVWKYVVALGGIAIAVMEGLLLLNQFGPLWIKYRATAESLKRERWLLLSRAGDYKGLPDGDALRLLAERVEVLLEVEHREWTQEQKQALAQLANTQDWLKRQRAEAQEGGATAPSAETPASSEEVSASDTAASASVAAPPAPADVAELVPPAESSTVADAGAPSASSAETFRETGEGGLTVPTPRG